MLFSKVDGGSLLAIKINWSQKLIHRDNQFILNIPFTFPEYVTPAGKKMTKTEKIQLNVNVGTGSEVLCKTVSHPLKVHLCLKKLEMAFVSQYLFLRPSVLAVIFFPYFPGTKAPGWKIGILI